MIFLIQPPTYLISLLEEKLFIDSKIFFTGVFFLFLNVSKRIFYPLLLLLVPVIGNKITDEINWSVLDFLIMGGFLLLVGKGINFVNSKKMKNRIFYIGLMIFIFILIWAELAVGVFGSPFAGS